MNKFFVDIDNLTEEKKLMLIWEFHAGYVEVIGFTG